MVGGVPAPAAQGRRPSPRIARGGSRGLRGSSWVTEINPNEAKSSAWMLNISKSRYKFKDRRSVLGERGTPPPATPHRESTCKCAPVRRCLSRGLRLRRSPGRGEDRKNKPTSRHRRPVSRVSAKGLQLGNVQTVVVRPTADRRTDNQNCSVPTNTHSK
jgi:hypothetical protein